MPTENASDGKMLILRKGGGDDYAIICSILIVFPLGITDRESDPANLQEKDIKINQRSNPN